MINFIGARAKQKRCDNELYWQIVHEWNSISVIVTCSTAIYIQRQIIIKIAYETDGFIATFDKWCSISQLASHMICTVTSSSSPSITWDSATLSMERNLSTSGECFYQYISSDNTTKNKTGTTDIGMGCVVGAQQALW